MPLYFLEHDHRFFHDQLSPALADSWRRRSFAPCLPLADALVAAGRAFVPAQEDEQPLLALLPTLPFDRDLWRLAAGEMLLFGARQMPVVPVAAGTLCQLLDGRESTSPIVQAHRGSRDLNFGGAFYRPDHAGLNDVADVVRLADFLASVDTSSWQADGLSALDHVDLEDRAEELAYACDCLAALRELYQQAARAGSVLVCEYL